VDINSGSHSIVLNSRDDQYERNLFSSTTNSLNSNRTLQHDAGVTLSTSSSSPPSANDVTGAALSTFVTAANAGSLSTNNVIWCEDYTGGGVLSATATSGGTLEAPVWQQWIKSLNAVTPGTLAFVLSANSDCSSPHTSISIPNLVAGTWIHPQFYDPLYGNKYDNPGIRSAGVVVVSGKTLAADTLSFSELDQTMFGSGSVISNNTIDQPGKACVLVAATTHGFAVNGNSCHDWGYLTDHSVYDTRVGVLVAPGVIGGTQSKGAGQQPACVSACPEIRNSDSGTVVGNVFSLTNGISTNGAAVRTCTGNASTPCTVGSQDVAGFLLDSVRITDNVTPVGDFASITTGSEVDRVGGTNITTGVMYPPNAPTLQLTADSSSITATTAATAVTQFAFTNVGANQRYSFHCSGSTTQATAGGGIGIAVQAATNAPTNLEAHATVSTSLTATNASATVLSTGSITTTTYTAAYSSTAGTLTTQLPWVLDGTIETAASPPTLNVGFFSGSASDAVTVKRGSYCTMTPQ
jgi:hypothetical protein